MIESPRRSGEKEYDIRIGSLFQNAIDNELF